MGGHISCYGWAWVATCHAMGDVGEHKSLLMVMVMLCYGLGMGTNSKENVGLCFTHKTKDM